MAGHWKTSNCIRIRFLFYQNYFPSINRFLFHQMNGMPIENVIFWFLSNESVCLPVHERHIRIFYIFLHRNLIYAGVRT